MPYKLYPETARGKADHGWLNARHTFSFASWHDPEKIHFGVLRVLNDDRIAAGMGFGMHPHDNMEIITIPLSGSVRHRDSMGNEGTIGSGEIQVMSAGSGVTHSEFNASRTDELSLFQIWIFPDTKNVAPRYDQWDYSSKEKNNIWTTLISPQSVGEGSWIHQDVFMKTGRFDNAETVQIRTRGKGYGLFFMVIEGEINILDQGLGARDAIGIWDEDSISFQCKQASRLLLIDLPMTV